MKQIIYISILFALISAVFGQDEKVREHYLKRALAEILKDPEILQNRVRKALDHYFRNPEYLRIEFFPTEKAELSRGYFERIDIQMKNTTIKILNVAEANISLNGLRIDLQELYDDGTIELINASEVKFHFLIDEASVNKAILEKKVPISNPHMKFNNGSLTFRGKWQTLFLRSEVETKGRLEIVDGNKIVFYPSRVKLNSIPLPKLIRNTIVHKINPIINMETMKFISAIDKIILKEGFIEIIKE